MPWQKNVKIKKEEVGKRNVERGRCEGCRILRRREGEEECVRSKSKCESREAE
jgi:hypothetical protein